MLLFGLGWVILLKVIGTNSALFLKRLNRKMIMNTPQEQAQAILSNQAPLTPLADFRKSGRAPVDMHNLILHHKKSLVDHGAICKFGRKWLVSEGHLFQWLREQGPNASRPKRTNELS